MPRVAFVYDQVNKWGGIERVFGSLAEIFPQAPLFTTVYSPQRAPWAKKFTVKTSFLNRLPFLRNHHEWFPFLAPLAFESLDFSGFDLVISITSQAGKGILTPPSTCHLCYCLTPTRYLYSGRREYLKNPGFGFLNPLARFSLKAFSPYLKRWDQVAASRPDFYLTLSGAVSRRLLKNYQRSALVIHPPVDTDLFQPPLKPLRGEFFLVVSRLVPPKRIDLAVKAFNKLGWPLVIVGTGNQLRRLQKQARANIKFTGAVSDSDLVKYYQRARALIFPSRDDFGLVPLEAQACGKPVLAFAGGGALETVLNNRTGCFFKKQTVASLLGALKKFTPEKYSPRDCRAQSQKFGKEVFIKKFKKGITQLWNKQQKKKI